MRLFFYAACILCILYCALFGVCSIADRHIAQGISALAMAAIAVGAVAVLMMVA